jgi:hypothetical protein
MPMLVVPETISITRNALKALLLMVFISSSLLRSEEGLSTGVPETRRMAVMHDFLRNSRGSWKNFVRFATQNVWVGVNRF